MERYTIVAKNDENSTNIATYLNEKLSKEFIRDDKNPELVISIGGDGTVLQTLHQFMEKDCFFVGVHTGTLGFFTDYLHEQVDQLVIDICTNQYTVQKRNLLDIDVYQGDKVKRYYAVNELRLDQGFTTQVMEVYINDELLEVFRGNGLCISTPSGSTAYNRSLGGAIIYPGVALMQLTEVAGIHHNAYRSLGSSLILDEKQVITIKSSSFINGSMGVDHVAFPLLSVDKIVISISKKQLKFVEYKDTSFIKRIRRSFING